MRFHFTTTTAMLNPKPNAVFILLLGVQKFGEYFSLLLPLVILMGNVDYDYLL